MRKLLAKIRKILKDRRTRQLLTRTVSVTAAIVVFVTTYALVLPAITMEAEADCGLEAHQHDSSCYEVRLVCSEAESPSHHHTEECCRITRTLVCSQDVHQHDGECYDDEGNLICEQVEHVHDDSCYEEVRELVCDIPESEGHQHTDACYDQVLICGKEAHTHSSACYSNSDSAASAWSTESVAVAATENSAAGITVQTYENAVIDADTDEEAVDSSDTFDNVDTFAPSETSNPANSIDTVAADGATGAASGASAVSETFANDAASANDEATASSSIVPAASTEATESSAAASSTSSTSSTVSNASSASAASTAAETSAEDAYVPVLDPLDFNQILTDETRIYYFHPENKEAEPENSGEITTWNLLDDKTILDSADIIRVYLAYSIPAGSLNETNPVARYRLPSNLHLSDSQVEAINSTVNGIANQYVSMDTLEITDPEKYSQALGVEAIEGTRQPSDDPEEYFAMHTETGGQEYISATVKAEDIYDTDDTKTANAGTDANDFDSTEAISSTSTDEEKSDSKYAANNQSGTYLGTDLVFTFTSYSVQKNQHTYDSTGKPTSAGQRIQGWLTFDLRTDQIDFETIDESFDLETKKNTGFELNISDSIETDLNENAVVTKEAAIIFVPETRDVQSGLDIGEISQTLHLQEIMTETDSAFKDKSEEADKGAGSDKGADSDKEDSKKAEKDDEAEKTALLYPAVTFQDFITASIGSLSTDTETGQTTALPEQTELTVYVEADEGTFPEGTTMKLSTVEDMDTVASAVEEAVTSDDAISNKTRGFHAVDISFRNIVGTEIEPLKPIRVSIKSQSIKQAVEDTSTAPVVMHVADPMADNAFEDRTDEDKSHNSEENDNSSNPEKAERPETEEYTKDNEDNESPIATVVETEKQVSTENSKMDDTDTLTFEAGTFSVYAIVYTVEFHWEVDGKTYDFSIPGGGFVSFEHLVEVLGIAVSDSNADSDDMAEAEVVENDADEVAENAGENQETSSTFDEVIHLNKVEVSEAARKFVADVESIEFTNPNLVWVGKVEEATTVGGLKSANGLEIEYSAELTEEQIAKINAQAVEAGDWALISARPFTSEETLTVTMTYGEIFTVTVTDYQNVNDYNSFNNNSTFVIWAWGSDGNSYALKSDGTTALINTVNPNDPYYVDKLGPEFQWKITYGWYVNNNETRYYIRPVADPNKYLYLSSYGNYVAPGDSLIRSQECGIRIYHADNNNTWKLEGWNWISLNLGNYTHQFEGNNQYYSQINLSRQQDIPEYEFTVRTEDIRRGFANGKDKDGNYKTGEREYDTKTNYVPNGSKTNLYSITAVPATDDQGGQKYLFDYWDLNGVRLGFGEVIGEGLLTIPRNKSVLTAHFKKNPNYVVPDEEKEGHSIDKQALNDWLTWLKDPDRVVPFEVEGCGKTAEVYDYENRIYQVDLTAQSNLPSFVGDIDLGFMLDVSASMKFPAKLDPVEGKEDVDINHINDNITNQDWLNKGTTYYLISDKGSTATVYEIRWGTWIYNSYGQTKTGWGYKDASKDDSNMRYILNSSAWSGGEVGESYPIYTNGDPGHTRSYYLESSITNTIAELNEILDALSVATNTGQEPKVKVAWNTFHKWVRDPHHDFTSVQGITVTPTYSYSGGTSIDLALLDAAGKQRNDPTGDDAGGRLYEWHPGITYSDADGFDWEDDAVKFAVLITDGAPQRNGIDVNRNLVDPAVEYLKAGKDGVLNTSDDVKLMSVGLSMGDVKKGSRLLYDISSPDEEGDPLFYKAVYGDELQYALYQMLQQTLGTAIVQSDISDKINEAFYPVDKTTGAPLAPGNVINLDGEKIGNSVNNLSDAQKKAGYGTIGWDNTNKLYTVQWTDQNVSGDGWHGTVYEKAKEDFLGGNTVRTNSGEAVIQAKSYKPNPDAAPIALKNSIVNGPGRITLETPRVNVNELDFLKNDTQWTVYLGTEVKNLQEQLQKLYENIRIEQVITAGLDTDGDGFKDKVDGNQNAYLFTMQQSALDKLDPKPGVTPQYMYLKDIIRRITGQESIDWTTLIEKSELEGDDNTGIEFPYNLYGQDCPGTITLKLTKDHNIEDHIATEPGLPVETYALEALFSPMYLHIPAGQSGTDPWEYHIGDFGLRTCGLAAGKDDCTNIHTVNVFAKKLQILKVDQAQAAITNNEAVFKLYREALDGEDELVLSPTDIPEFLPAGKNYILADTLTTDSEGKATTNIDISKLPDNKPYYLVETIAPDRFVPLNGALEVRAVTDAKTNTGAIPQDVWTKVPVTTPPQTSNTRWNPYVLSNWEQNATIIVNGDGNLEGYVIREGNIVYDHNQEESMISVGYMIRNYEGVELPAAGGHGSTMIYLLGIIFICVAGVGMAMGRRRKAV